MNRRFSRSLTEWTPRKLDCFFIHLTEKTKQTNTQTKLPVRHVG